MHIRQQGITCRWNAPIVLFDWEPGRTPDYPRDFLSGFSGTIVNDGYKVYHKIASERDDLKVAGWSSSQWSTTTLPHLIPFTIGSKNYLFCESVNGAKASAIIYSIVETAKANELNVYKYLEFLITELSERKKDGSLDHIDGLLPWAKTPQKECKVPIKIS